ncbi:MAG TPA: hypothetical protein DCG49_05735 [Ruminococcus sp.]|nr:hypothetical protein [Ruminococcus sp.]
MTTDNGIFKLRSIALRSFFLICLFGLLFIRRSHFFRKETTMENMDRNETETVCNAVFYENACIL